MMNYLENQNIIYPWDIEGDDEELLTAHVYVPNESAGLEFIEYYKEAKKVVR